MALVPLLVAAGCLAMGFPSGDSLRFALVFTLFLVPGWCLAARLLGHEAGLPVRLPVALLLSYGIYAVLALGCRALDLGYGAFLTAFALALVVSIGVWRRGADDAQEGERRRWTEAGLVLVALLLSLVFFTFPPNEDQGLWDFNILESLERRSFAPSSLDVRPFGLDAVQPRMQANLFHAFFAVLGAVSDVSPRVLIYDVAPPFLGVFLFLALALFVAEVAGPRVDPALALAAVVTPATLSRQASTPYWYEFRVLNSPTLDKDFCTFFLLPMLLWLGWRHLLGGERRWLALLALGVPVAVWSHPVTPVFLLLGIGVLAVATFERTRLARVAGLLATSAAGVGLSVLLIDPGATHEAIERLLAFDLRHGTPHFWRGQYIAPGWNQVSSVVYTPEGDPLFRTQRFFGSGLVRYSVLLTPLWLALLLASRRGARASLLGLAAGTLLAAGAVWLLARLALRAAPEILWLSASLAALAIGLALADAWRAGAAQDAERRALRVQCAFVALLALLYVGATQVLQHRIELFRGLERLHWMYLGFFAFAFVGQYAADGVGRLLGRVVRTGPAGLSSAVLLALLALHVADQAQAHWGDRDPVLARLGVGNRFAEPNRRWSERRRRILPLRALEGGRGAHAGLAAPGWLEAGDVVLHVQGRSPVYQYVPYRLPLMRQSAYYRELYSEAFAFQQLGEPFLERFLSYNDAVDGVVSPRLLRWLEAERVSVIAIRRPNLVDRLRRVWPHPIEEIDRYVHTRIYRIRPPPQRGAEGSAAAP